MSKFLKIPYGDYTIEVREDGEIRLDTGESKGRVVITGDLFVTGNTTTSINSTDTDIKDNIILLNSGEIGFGVFNDESGIEIDRGLSRNALMVFDETQLFLDPQTGELVKGSFVFKKSPGLDEDSTYEDESLVGIKTSSIGTNGTDLYLINSGTGVISVTGTVDYELNVTDDDHIPNKKYVDNAIDFALGAGTSIQSADTKVETFDFENTGSISNIDFQVDGTSVANLTSTDFVIFDLVAISNRIEAKNNNEDIVLTATGTGSVTIDRVLQIPKSIEDPEVPTDGVKVYTKEEAAGGTGIYYTNESGTRDELISRNRALLYSMVI